MTREQEQYLWERIRRSGEDGTEPRAIISEMIEKEILGDAREAWMTLEYWSEINRYDWGVSLDMGWREGDGDELPPEEGFLSREKREQQFLKPCPFCASEKIIVSPYNPPGETIVRYMKVTCLVCDASKISKSTNRGQAYDAWNMRGRVPDPNYEREDEVP